MIYTKLISFSIILKHFILLELLMFTSKKGILNVWLFAHIIAVFLMSISSLAALRTSQAAIITYLDNYVLRD